VSSCEKNVVLFGKMYCCIIEHWKAIRRLLSVEGRERCVESYVCGTKSLGYVISGL
jgi:hypothetical protein